MCSNRLVRNFHPPRAARRLVSTPPRAFSGARSVRAFRADKEGAFPEPSSLDSDRNENSPKTLFFFFFFGAEFERLWGVYGSVARRDVQQEPRHPLSSPGRADEPRRDQPRAQDARRTPRSSMDNGRRELHRREPRSAHRLSRTEVASRQDLRRRRATVNRDMEDKMVSGLI